MDHELTPRQRARYDAAERQGWCCWICGVPMLDLRNCDVPGCRDERHRAVALRMPRFNHPATAEWATLGNPHAATLAIGGTIHAAHLSCVNAFQALHIRHGRSVDSAIQELRNRLADSATGQMHNDPAEPVDKSEKAQRESATGAPNKAQLPGCTTPPDHSTTSLHVSRTSGSAESARVRDLLAVLDLGIAQTGSDDPFIRGVRFGIVAALGTLDGYDLLDGVRLTAEQLDDIQRGKQVGL